jgi:hypothetical protein
MQPNEIPDKLAPLPSNDWETHRSDERIFLRGFGFTPIVRSAFSIPQSQLSSFEGLGNNSQHAAVLEIAPSPFDVCPFFAVFHGVRWGAIEP